MFSTGFLILWKWQMLFCAVANKIVWSSAYCILSSASYLSGSFKPLRSCRNRYIRLVRPGSLSFGACGFRKRTGDAGEVCMRLVLLMVFVGVRAGEMGSFSVETACGDILLDGAYLGSWSLVCDFGVSGSWVLSCACSSFRMAVVSSDTFLTFDWWFMSLSTSSRSSSSARVCFLSNLACHISTGGRFQTLQAKERFVPIRTFVRYQLSTIISTGRRDWECLSWSAHHLRRRQDGMLFFRVLLDYWRNFFSSNKISVYCGNSWLFRLLRQSCISSIIRIRSLILMFQGVIRGTSKLTSVKRKWWLPFSCLLYRFSSWLLLVLFALVWIWNVASGQSLAIVDPIWGFHQSLVFSWDVYKS